MIKQITPNIFVNDLPATLAFYQHLGFTLEQSVPEGASEEALVWVMLGQGSVKLMFQTLSSLEETLPQIPRQSGGPWLLYLQVTGIRTLFADLSTRATVVQGLEKTFYGATEFSILDPNGFVLTFAEDED